MTDEEKKTLIGLMSDEQDESVVAAYFSLAKQIIFEKAFPFGDYPEELPGRYDSVHVDIAVYMLNKRGAEGEIVHLENGVSRHWDAGSIPPSLLRRIIPFAGVVGGSKNETGETEP